MKKDTSADPTISSSTDTPAVKLTREQHDARAMLLGRQFWPMSYVYATMASVDSDVDSWWDADTLEPITRKQRMDRYMNTYGEGRWLQATK